VIIKVPKEEKIACFDFTTYHEGANKIIKINMDNCLFPPSIEYSKMCMGKVIDTLLKIPGVTNIVLSQRREYDYDEAQVAMLYQLAYLYKRFNQDERYLYSHIVADPVHERFIRSSYAIFQRLLHTRLKEDPLATYVELKRFDRHEKIKLKNIQDPNHKQSQEKFISIITDAINKIETLNIVRNLVPHLKEEYKTGDRQLYSYVLNPSTKPDFMYTKLISEFPKDGELLESYEFGEGDEKVQINIFGFEDSIKYLYHITPPESRLKEEEYELLDGAKRILSEHKPTRKEFVDPQRMREVFFNIGKDLIGDLAEHRGLKLKEAKINLLTKSLLRYTVGFGLMELMLSDPKIQDVNVNSPNGEVPIFVVHQDYGDCDANVYPTKQEVDSWATKLRLISGRPLDEANPILDTELKVEGFSSRISVVSAPLDPFGMGFSFRRHRDHPWTFPLYLQPKFKMMNQMGAGLLSFLIDGNATILIAGTRSSGKSSFLGSVLVEMMRRYRIITIEDSVTGDSRILTSKNNKSRYRKIEEVFKECSKTSKVTKKLGREIIDNPKFKVNSVDKEGKLTLSEASKIIRHKVKKQLYKITTATGRVLKVTKDHSLFTIGTKNLLKEAKTGDLSEGDYIATPRKLLLSTKGEKEQKLLDLNKILKPKKDLFIKLNTVKKVNKEKITKRAKKQGIHKTTINKWFKLNQFPSNFIDQKSKNEITHLKLGSNSHIYLSANIKLDDDFLSFIGLWIADGCYDKNSVIMSVSSKEEQTLVKRIAKRFNLTTKIHSDKFSLMINSKTFRYIMHDLLELNGNAYTKKLPEWVFSLSNKQKGYLLKGFFSGDGCASDKEVITSLASMRLLEDIQTILLGFGIIFRINRLRKRKHKDNDRTKDGRISTIRDLKLFEKHIAFLQKYKNNKLRILTSKKSTHDSTDIVPLPLKIREEIAKYTKRSEFNTNDYIKRKNNIGRNKLGRILSTLKNNEKTPKKLVTYLKHLAKSDIYWDKIVKTKKIELKDPPVYDISVPGNENFIADNILAHNTLELPSESLRKLGYNIESLKVGSALSVEKGSEVDASTGIRSTLRLGDSALIVGEVRSSLRGDQEVVIIDNKITKRVPIASLETKNLKNVFVPTLDKEQKMQLKKLTAFVKHPKRKKLVKIITKTGREVTVTPDHSVFTHVNFKIAAINADQLTKNDPIIIPGKLPCGYNDISHFNLLEQFKDKYRLEGAETYIRKAIKKLGWKKCSKICGIVDIYRYLLSTQKTRIPIDSFLKLMQKAKIKFNINDLKIKKGTSLSIPANFPINENIMRLLGYYLAEGNIDGKKVQITNSKPKIIADVKEICKREFNYDIHTRKVYGLGSSTQMFICSKPLLDLFRSWNCGNTSFYKKVPNFVFGLNKEKICALLRGMYSGDGSISMKKGAGTMIRYFSTSKRLVEDVAYLLLSVGIVCRIHSRERDSNSKGTKKIYIAEIKQRKYVKTFLQKIGFTHKNPVIKTKGFAHSKDDSVSFDPKVLEQHLKLPRNYRHLRRTKSCSKEYLKRITKEVPCSDEIFEFAHGDFFIDKIKEIIEIELEKPEFVYDLSVKSTERFIGGFGGILLHNTEAISLYEAMRVGAAANVVAGTIHAASPYGVYDRVVNDIGVPKTSFKATDIIVITNPVRSASGMKKLKRVLRITEIRKLWEDDPLKEGAFVDLMIYNPETDQLEITDDLINGNSDVLKRIAGSIKEFAGNWDAVWDNIQLRGKCKQAVVDASLEANDPDMLEAEFVIKANDRFHILSGKLQEKLGYQDTNKIFFEYNEWLQKEVRKRKLKRDAAK